MPLFDNQRLDQMTGGSTCLEMPTKQVPAKLRRRVELLLREDRAIFDLIFQQHLPRQQVARVLGLDAGTVTRRFHRLMARLREPTVAFLLDPACPITPEHRQIGIEHFLQGLSQRQLADKHRMRPELIRQIISFIRGWCRGVRSLNGQWPDLDATGRNDQAQQNPKPQ